MAKLICSAVKYCIYEYPTKITVSSTSWSIPSHLDSIPGMGFIFLSSSSRLEPSLWARLVAVCEKRLGKCLVGEWVAGWIQGDRRCALPIRLQIKSYTSQSSLKTEDSCSSLWWPQKWWFETSIYSCMAVATRCIRRWTAHEHSTETNRSLVLCILVPFISGSSQSDWGSKRWSN